MSNIRVVDDKDSMRNMLTETLTDEGHAVEIHRVTPLLFDRQHLIARLEPAVARRRGIGN